MKPITVRLVGGLGNQLFGYYAGAALAAHLSAPLRLDGSWTRHGITDHGIGILDLELPGEWTIVDDSPVAMGPPGGLPRRAAAKLLRTFPTLGRPIRVHQARDIGWDPELFDQPPGTRLRGYFQSWRIVERAVVAGYPRRPGLRQPSPWMERTIARMAADQPIAVHVRRGDYLTTTDFEILGSDYYEAAVHLLRERGVTGPVWLFSDQPEAATAALGRVVPDEVMSSPDGAPTELLAMSHAPARVIANSTFSWWAGWMAGDATLTVAPSRWFSGAATPDDLLPPGWLVADVHR